MEQLIGRQVEVRRTLRHNGSGRWVGELLKVGAYYVVLRTSETTEYLADGRDRTVASFSMVEVGS